MSDCLTCAPPATCLPEDPFGLYSINGEVFPIIINCPVGQTCAGPGTPISITRCGQTFTAIIPVNASEADIQAIIADLWAKAYDATVHCPGPDPIPDPQPTPPGPTPDPPHNICFNTAQTATKCCPDGTPFSFTVPAGRFFDETYSRANAAALNYAKHQIDLYQICLGELTSVCSTDQSISFSLTASGAGVGTSNTWSLASGSVPTGMVLQVGTHGATITLSGTPTTPGVYTFLVKVEGPIGSWAQKTFVVEVLAVMTQNTAYANVTLAPPSCGAASTDKTLSGHLPAGINWSETITAADELDGTPTTVGTCAFTLTYA